MLRVAVLLSGRGSNLQALIDACGAPDFPAEIIHVISNNPDAVGLLRAQDAGIETSVLNHREYETREAFDTEVTRVLEDANAELVCLAGFMRILTEGFVSHWTDRLLNIHPSLLPSFKGLDAQQQALDAGVKLAGCSVHFVRPGVDEGPIIAQAAVPVLDDDDAKALSARILALEHRLYPRVVRLIAEGRVTVVDERVTISDSQAPTGALSNPSRD
ncbi:MAG: phosphoribosylglycinamide formyltransferase [Rhodospirillaceae bacterium]|nr:phosphoribosylglycinamide formyltransferase [Rhodospirillaceae bacterium]MDD9915194.1 phosphoribosylglycinamide formyltransferase [Rhodospirillaceae bacterium]MDD9925549.1 phosphoribosylglycinamide formyltransferase [Rhodospirillaceae bacterium]